MGINSWSISILSNVVPNMILAELSLSTSILLRPFVHNGPYHQGITMWIVQANCIILGKSNGLHIPFDRGSIVVDYGTCHRRFLASLA